ncbi:unnamed protein product [Clonostachys byssicola]|uniref:Uncharacterized protein n=1 Tax=Clonostachys byssicola TaxID=160290 RepID=A0A9N9UH07_9HYPO|nr:unnamed protein product [Clonostachys byssicola]
MSNFLQRIKMAGICREITDEISPILNDSIKPDYQVVLGFDKRLQQLEEQLPGFFQLNPSQEQVELCKGPGKGFRSILVFMPDSADCIDTTTWKYSYSRNACVRSAQKIIEIRRAMDDPELSSSYNPAAPGAESQRERVMVAYRTLERSKKSLNGLISGIQRNIRTIMASFENNYSRSADESTEKGVPAFSNQTQPSNVVLDGESNEGPEDTLMGDGRWEESHELWTEFLATVPDLKKFEWNSLLDDVDLDPSHLFK